MARSVVPLPRDVRSPFQVYVNGVPQRLGDDYVVESGALVADVDRVVLAVGADAPGADEPPPLRDAVLLERALEDERPVLDRVVVAEALRDAVEVHLEGRAHLAGKSDDGPGHFP